MVFYDCVIYTVRKQDLLKNVSLILRRFGVWVIKLSKNVFTNIFLHFKSPPQVYDILDTYFLWKRLLSRSLTPVRKQSIAFSVLKIKINLVGIQDQTLIIIDGQMRLWFRWQKSVSLLFRSDEMINANMFYKFLRWTIRLKETYPNSFLYFLSILRKTKITKLH